MRRSELVPDACDVSYVSALHEIAVQHGITNTGVAPADVMGRARDELHRRRDLGLHDGMQFTYKNPDRSTDPARAVPGAQAVFVGARPYDHDAATAGSVSTDPPVVGARVARYAWADHYAPLREGLWAVANRLRGDGWKAVVFADDNSMVDREIAYRAGIGWFGKNSNLLVPGAGSWFVLGSVVTTAPLPVQTTPIADGCGSCRRCLDGCPTGAIIEPGVVDAARCLAWLLQKPGIFPRAYRSALGNRIYGCDDCQEVCPPTVRFSGGSSAAEPVRSIEPMIDALDLLDASSSQILARWGRWYIADRDARWVRRNALIVVANAGRADDGRVRAVIANYLVDDDPMLRAHAVWAARTLGLHSMVPATDDDPDVRAEMTALL